MIRVEVVYEGRWLDIKTVRLRALAESPAAFGSTLAREAAFDEDEWKSRAASGRWVLAYDGDEPIGVVCSRDEEQRPDDETHIVAMWVAPSFRGEGVAGRLIDAVAQQSLERGRPKLTLFVADTNDRARAFYDRLGFTPTGDRMQLPSNPEIGEDRLERRAI